MNRSRSKTQAGGGPKKGEGSGASPPEKLQEPSRSTESVEARDESVETEDIASHEKTKELETVISDQGRDNEEETAETKVGESHGKSDEDPDSEEEEEEEGEIEITTPRMTKTKGRKTRKEEWEQATYKDKLQGPS